MTHLRPTLSAALIAIATLTGASFAQSTMPDTTPGTTQVTTPTVNPAPLEPKTVEPTTTEPMKVVPVSPDPLKVDLLLLKAGYRASSLIGASVLSESGDKVGTIDDLIILKDNPAPFAVMAVGGVLGFGARYVVVSTEALVIGKADIRLTGSNSETLGMLPDFQYTN